jgi:YVTN family beta-propeller protein
MHDYKAMTETEDNPMNYSSRRSTLTLIALVIALGAGLRPAAAQPPGPRVYVTNSAGGHSVSVIDAGTNTVIATIPVGLSPNGIAVTPDGAFVYVANEGGTTVSVIDTAVNAVVETVTVGLSPKEVAVSPDGLLVYVTRPGWNRIALIDTATNTVVDNLAIYDPWNLVFTPDGATLYVSHANLSAVSAIDTTTRTVVATVPLPSNSRFLAVTPNGAFVYVGSFYSNSEVWVIETATNTLVATIPLGGGARVTGLAVTPDGVHAYAVHLYQISAIDTATNTIVGTVPLGGGSHGAIAFTSGSCVRGYVTSDLTPADGRVRVLKPAPVDFIMGDVSVGSIPAGVAVSPPAPNTDTWTVVAPMPTPRSELAAATAVGADGRSKIYALGGRNAEGSVLSTVEAYDPDTDTWTTVASMSTPRTRLAAATGLDGRIYAIGGRNLFFDDLGTVEAYDPLTDTWTTVAPVQFQCQEGAAPRRTGHAAVTGPDGRIYAIGGFCGSFPNPSMANGTPSVEAYDPFTNAWTFVAPIPSFGVGRYLLAAATGPDGLIYGIGGALRDFSGFEALYSTVAAYDSSTDTWKSVPPVSTPRFDLAAATGPDGKVYAIAGMSQTPAGRYFALDLMDAYDPSTDSWTSCSCLPTSFRSGLAAVRGPDGRIYAIGGRDHHDNTLDTVEAYAP